MVDRLPYTIAALCYLFDSDGRILLLHRSKPPNQGLYSPIGGKLDQAIGESPADCAIREIHEETGLRVDCSQLHLTGIVSESCFDDQMHWLMFLYEVTESVHVDPIQFAEGQLGWHPEQQIDDLNIPDTDRQVIWPLFRRYRGRFFTAHIDCSGGQLKWQLQQPEQDVHANIPLS